MHKTLTLLSLFICIVLYNCKTQNPNLECKDFKKGTFEMINAAYNERYIFKRNNSLQMEEVYDLNTGELVKEKGMTLDTNWVDECEYRLTVNKQKSRYDTVDLVIDSLGGVHCKILDINKNCATMEVGVKFIVDTMIMCKKE